MEDSILPPNSNMPPKTSTGPKKQISKCSSLPSRRQPQISKISQAHAQIVLNVRNTFEKEKKRGRISRSLNEVIKRTSDATGISSSVVKRIANEEDVSKFDISSKISRERKSAVPIAFAIIIRQILRDQIITTQRLPTLDSILEILTQGNFDFSERFALDGATWTWSKETLRRFMNCNGFEHGARKSHYEFTKERGDIVSLRENYLARIQNYRQEGYIIFYQDETWVYKNMAVRKLWQTKNIREASEIHYRVPSGSDPRLIVSHVASSSTGPLDKCLLMFKGEKNPSANYHTEMNSEVFFEWLRSTVFPEMKRNGRKRVLVMDHATYHTKLTEHTKPPVSSWRKRDLVPAIKRWGGRVPSSWPIVWLNCKTNIQLLRAAKRLAPPPKYVAQEIADSFAEGEFCIKILFLPVAHPELNPIEMVWGHVKRAVSAANLGFSLRDVWWSTEHELRKIDAGIFAKYKTHSIGEENRYRILGDIIDAGSDEGSDYVLSACDGESSFDSQSVECTDDVAISEGSGNSSISDSE